MRLARKLEVVMFAATVLGLIFCPRAGFGAVAEETPMSPVEGEEVVEEEVLGPEEEVGPTVAITPTGLISFDFREAPIQEVLRIFARRVNVNIIATPLVQGMVSMKLENVKWRKALESILDVNKLKMTEDKENNIIKVMTADEVQAEPLETQIYPLSYVQAEDVIKVLSPLLDETEKIQFDKAGNKLIVHAKPATHETLSVVIEDLDAQTKQVLIEVKFIEASTEAGKDLGIKWDFLKEYAVEATGLTTSYEKGISKLFDTRAGESDRGALSERISRSGEDQRDSGRDWSNETSYSSSSDLMSSDGLLTTTGSMGSALSSDLRLTRDLSSSGRSSFSSDTTRNLERTSAWDRSRSDATEVLKTATLSADSVRLVLSALYTDADAKLVSNPRISTVDNKEAEIKAVRQFPIPKWTFNSDTGSWEVQGFEYKDIGVILNVTPHINQDNFITLDVLPEVSNQTGTVIFGGGAGGTAEIPIIDARNAQTRVIVKSGETLVIGGLMRTDEITRKSGVPLLKDIPLLGNIFKHSSKTMVNLDLLIFITPTIVEGPAASILAPPAEYLEGSTGEPKAEVTGSLEKAK